MMAEWIFLPLHQLHLGVRLARTCRAQLTACGVVMCHAGLINHFGCICCQVCTQAAKTITLTQNTMWPH